ncbi:hypothetical protein VP01_335g7 [Puccinia sorghi]|uniref:Uncharacterized protein n=1 Tax=Puccinia sorghi TaxID=27349 RepID=A0A0L6UWY6_9BASI|nr:hypothetical protein VP01_335g7 [Puccinia sorghi]
MVLMWIGLIEGGLWQNTIAKPNPCQRLPHRGMQYDRQVPQALREKIPNQKFEQIECLQLNKHKKICKYHFVLVNCQTEYIGQVNSTSFFVQTTMKRGRVNTYYRMREFEKTKETTSVSSKDIVAALNLQHNCDEGKCPMKKTKTMQLERQDTSIKINQICHANLNKYILNAASCHAPEEHQRLGNMFFRQVGAREIAVGLETGLEIWEQACFPDS